MTMGLAMVLDGSIALWADGRKCTIADPDTPVSEDDDKIEIIAPQLALMTSGVDLLGQRVINNIRLNYRPDLTLPQIIDLVEFCLTHSWDNCIVEAGFDMENPMVSCGVLLAGYAAGQPFGLLSRQLYRKSAEPQYTTEPYQTIVNVKDVERAIAISNEELDRELTEEVCTGTYDDYLQTIIRIGATTIRRIAEYNHGVGGVIRCAVSRRGAPFQKQIVEGI